MLEILFRVLHNGLCRWDVLFHLQWLHESRKSEQDDARQRESDRNCRGTLKLDADEPFQPPLSLLPNDLDTS